MNINNSNFDEQPCFLLQMPLEVIEHIFMYLCPRSVIAITSLNIEKFYYAASKLKSFDFSMCNDIFPNEMSLLLTSNRMNHIKALNFNYVFLVRSCDLVQFIVKYKHLTSLSIIESGIKFKSLYFILEQCKELKELFWNVCPYESDFSLSFQEKQSYGIKKLFLCLNQKTELLKIAIYIAERCLLAEEIFLNFSSSPFPLRSRCSTLTFRLHNNSKCPVKIVVDDWNDSVNKLTKHIRDRMKCCSDDEWVLSLQMTSPYLQLVTRHEDFSLLSSIADESVPSLVLYCATDPDLMNEIDPVKRVTGKSLTYLCIKKMQFQAMPEILSGLHRNSTIHRIIPYLIVDCHNIKDLILSDLHFDHTFNLKILSTIKALTTLFIPTCFLKPFSNEDCHLENNFENFVKKSKGIQHFSIKGCNTCTFGPKDEHVAVISEWFELRTLSLVKIKSLVFCHFLRDVTDKCIHLRNVELLMIGSSAINNFIPSVTYMLENSPQLMFLSTTLDFRCARSKRFWNSIGLAKNLQGLCLIETTGRQGHCKPIIDAINKLKYLHLFHLISGNRIENLEQRVSRAMKRNGVKNPKVIIMDNCLNFTHCDFPHLMFE